MTKRIRLTDRVSVTVKVRDDNGDPLGEIALKGSREEVALFVLSADLGATFRRYEVVNANP